MDLCVWDWSIIKDILVALISAGIPSLVAWVIFKGWRSQKVKELLAIRAKEVYFELDKLIIALKHMDTQINENPGTTTTNCKSYIELKETYKEILSDLTLFKDLLKEENSSHSKKFDAFYDTLVSFDEDLKWVNLWRIVKPNKKIHPLVVGQEHSKYIKEKLGIQHMRDAVKNIKLELTKIILHK
jgi:hypothetical protein